MSTALTNDLYMLTVIETPIFMRFADMLRNEKGELVLLTSYAKAEQDTLSNIFLR